jgi:alpha-1,2-mannosyltransferase
MRILVIHPEIRTLAGGERVCMHTLKALDDSGHKVTLISDYFDKHEIERRFGFPIPHVDALEYHGFWEFKTVFPRFSAVQRIITNTFYEWRLKNNINTDDFDLVMSTNHPVYALPCNPPLVQYCHHPPGAFALAEGPLAPSFRAIGTQPVQTWIRRKLAAIDMLLANSDFTKNAIQTGWHRDAVTIYPPCRLSDFEASSNKTDTVVSIGRISPEKRFEIMLAIAKKMPDVSFRILGALSSQKTDYLQTLLGGKPPNVTITINAPLRVLTKALSEAKLYMQLGENEPFGISIVEAMASGCVPIVHKSGGAAEIVKEDCGSLWVTIDEATSQIKDALAREDALKGKSDSARKRAKLFDSSVFEAHIKRIASSFDRKPIVNR